MSTKWNNAQRLQKTPKVCKKGPADLPEDLRQFRYYPLQAWASWEDDRSGADLDFSGQTTLAAHPLAHTHAGAIVSEELRMDLLLAFDPVSLVFTYTIELTILDIARDGVMIQFIAPGPVLPFEAGQFTWTRPANPRIIKSKIYS